MSTDVGPLPQPLPSPRPASRPREAVEIPRPEAPARPADADGVRPDRVERARELLQSGALDQVEAYREAARKILARARAGDV